MEIRGHLSECSYTDLLHILEHLKSTGCLSLHAPPGTASIPELPCQLWFAQGSIVAGCISPTNTHTLIALIHQQSWLADQTVDRFTHRCPSNTPLGRYLRSQFVLTETQLQHLFRLQLHDPLRLLTAFSQPLFQFTSTPILPHLQMTGLSLRVKDILDLVHHGITQEAVEIF